MIDPIGCARRGDPCFVGKLLAGIAEILEVGDSKSFDDAIRFLACATDSVLRPQQRNDLSEAVPGRRSLIDDHPVLDTTTAGYRGLIAETPEIADALAIYALDPVVMLLVLARRDLPVEFQHAVDVAGVARRLALRCRYSDGAVRAFTAAALFHDLGRVLMRLGEGRSAEPSSVPTRSPGDFARLSGLLLTACGVQPAICVAVRQHHEAVDGSGWPLGLKRDQVGVGARFVAVADVACGHAGIDAAEGPSTRIERAITLLEGRGSRFDATLALIAASMLASETLLD